MKGRWRRKEREQIVTFDQYYYKKDDLIIITALNTHSLSEDNSKLTFWFKSQLLNYERIAPHRRYIETSKFMFCSRC